MPGPASVQAPLHDRPPAWRPRRLCDVGHRFPCTFQIANVLNDLRVALLHCLCVGVQRQPRSVLSPSLGLQRLYLVIDRQRQEVVALVQFSQGLGGRVSDPLIVLDHFVDAAPSGGLGQYRSTAQPSIESPAIFPVSTSFVRAAAAFPVVP